MSLTSYRAAPPRDKGRHNAGQNRQRKRELLVPILFMARRAALANLFKGGVQRDAILRLTQKLAQSFRGLLHFAQFGPEISRATDGVFCAGELTELFPQHCGLVCWCDVCVTGRRFPTNLL